MIERGDIINLKNSGLIIKDDKVYLKDFGIIFGFLKPSNLSWFGYKTVITDDITELVALNNFTSDVNSNQLSLKHLTSKLEEWNELSEECKEKILTEYTNLREKIYF